MLLVAQFKERIAELEAELRVAERRVDERQAAHDLLVRLSQWDALNPPIEPFGRYGDAPYWKREIDRVLAERDSAEGEQ